MRDGAYVVRAQGEPTFLASKSQAPAGHDQDI